MLTPRCLWDSFLSWSQDEILNSCLWSSFTMDAGSMFSNSLRCSVALLDLCFLKTQMHRERERERERK